MARRSNGPKVIYSGNFETFLVIDEPSTSTFNAVDKEYRSDNKPAVGKCDCQNAASEEAEVSPWAAIGLHGFGQAQEVRSTVGQFLADRHGPFFKLSLAGPTRVYLAEAGKEWPMRKLRASVPNLALPLPYTFFGALRGLARYGSRNGDGQHGTVLRIGYSFSTLEAFPKA